MLALGHALAQALGGRYGLPHGAMNALSLPPALRFNAAVVPEAVARFAAALGVDDAAARVEELARLGGFERLRDFGVPEEDLPDVAEAAVATGGREGEPAPGERSRGSRSCCARSGELGGFGGTSLVAGVRCSFRGKDAGSADTWWYRRD